ncbi:MAG: helix-turn-helix transcriptional regulator [Oscillospiraceae bacterium]|nr:helix-turn-helix transcriptional regulator [Oscillospiraceae bacterium]
MKFHEKLYTLRKAAGMTQTDLAEQLNVSRQAVSRWEQGTAMPDVENLIAMSDLFGVTLDDLLKNREDAPEEEVPGERIVYWDFLPRKWWLLPAAAVGLKLLAFLAELCVLLLPGASSGTAVDAGGVSLFFMMLLSIPGMNLISAILLALTACCFLWALVKWIKAKV